MSEIYGFTLIGKMPLLMHADDVEASDAISAWRKEPDHKNMTTPGDDRSPPFSWQSYLYSDGKHIAVPAENIMVSLRSAGTQMIMKRNKTFKEASQSGLIIHEEFCELTVNGKQVPIEKYDYRKADMTDFAAQKKGVEADGFTLFVKRARVNNSKHVRVRPRFNQWQVRGTIQILASEITEDILRRLFQLAGRTGIGDWRPGGKTPGVYGQYEAALARL